MSEKFIPYRSSKKQRIQTLNADLQTEITAMQTVYSNLAGENADPVIAASTDKAVLLAAIAALVQPPAAPSLEVVAAIPTTLVPGQRVWCTATNSEWIGADPANGIFPTLANGTPWPVRGYKNVSFHLQGSLDASWSWSITPFSNKDGADLNALTFSFNQYGAFVVSSTNEVYSFVFQNFFLLSTSPGSYIFNHYANGSSMELSLEYIDIDTPAASGSFNIYLMFKIYPPLS